MPCDSEKLLQGIAFCLMLCCAGGARTWWNLEGNDIYRMAATTHLVEAAHPLVPRWLIGYPADR